MSSLSLLHSIPEWMSWSILCKILSLCWISSTCTTYRPLLVHTCQPGCCHWDWTEENRVKILDNIDHTVTLSHWGADLSNRLPQLKHRRPALCLPVLEEEEESEGNTICLGSLDRKSSGALHPVTWHRHVDTCSSSWSSHTGDTRPGSWVSGSGSWAGQQPRSGSEQNTMSAFNINTGTLNSSESCNHWFDMICIFHGIYRA